MLPARRAGRRSTSTIRAAQSLVDVVRPSGHLRDQPGRPTSTPGPLSFSLDGLQFDVAHAAGRGARALDAGRPAERLQHPRRRRDGGGARRPARRDRTGLRQLPGVPGRFEVASTPDDDVTVVVDYAHTDDALRNLLETARPLARAAPDHGVRRRRRSRPHEAAADGHGGGAAERRRDHHVGQPARRGPGADHRGSEARRRRRRRARAAPRC